METENELDKEIEVLRANIEDYKKYQDGTQEKPFTSMFFELSGRLEQSKLIRNWLSRAIRNLKRNAEHIEVQGNKSFFRFIKFEDLDREFKGLEEEKN